MKPKQFLQLAQLVCLNLKVYGLCEIRVCVFAYLDQILSLFSAGGQCRLLRTIFARVVACLCLRNKLSVLQLEFFLLVTLIAFLS